MVYIRREANATTELQAQYGNYKSALQQIAQKIGDVESEAEEHKYAPTSIYYFAYTGVAEA